MKKLLLIFSLVLCVFLTGCSKSDDSKTVLKFSSWGSKTEYKILKQVIAQYEQQNPNVKIEFIHVPENYFRKLHLLYASKTEPDVVFVNNTYAPLYIQAGLLEDLNGKFNEQNFFPSAVNCFKYDDKVYAIPRDVSNLVLFVNKDLVKYPEKIKTLEDLKTIAKNSAKNGTFGLNYEKNPLFWLYYLAYFNGGILSDNGKKVIFDTPESLKGLTYYSDMINKDKSIPHDYQMSGMTSAQMFINGKIAIYLSGRWLVPKFRETIKFDWDVIPFPQSKTSKTLTDSSGWAISKSSEHKDLALDFIKYLSSKEVIATFTKSGLITPARIDIANSELFLDKKQKPKNSKAFLLSIQNSKPTPVNANYAKITDDIMKSVDPVLNGKINPEKIMTPELIKKLNKHCNQRTKN